MVAVHKREAEVARDRTPALSRAWDRTLRRAGAAFKGLNVVPDTVTIAERATLAAGLEALPETGLVAALEDRDGHRGLIGLSHGVVDALIEVQTTGKVEARGLPPRPVTRIDEALSRDFLDLGLAAWTHETTEHEDRDWPERMSFGSAVPDRRQLPLLMPERAYHILSATVSLGEDVPREGQVMLLLPCTGPARAPDAGPRTAAPPPEAQPAEWKAAMAAAMQEAELELDAVLLRTRRSLCEVERLKPGDLIHFGPDELASVRLETPAGRHVVTGRLGQIGGNRALRLVAPVGTSPVRMVPPGPARAGAGAQAAGLPAPPPGGPGAGGFDPKGAAMDAAPHGPMGGGDGPSGGAPGGDLPGGALPEPGPLGAPSGPGDLPEPGFPDPGHPGPGAGMAPDLPDLPAPGGFEPAPAPLDFAPQTAPIDFDNLPE
jgi:flagellar motor switch protein FliM